MLFDRFLFLKQVILREVGCALDLTDALFVKLNKLFLSVKDFFKEFLSTSPSSHFLSRSHLLLKSIQSARFFLTVSENALSFVKVSVDELGLKEEITVRLAHQFGICGLVGLHVGLDLLSEGLLDGVELDQVELHLRLFFDPLWRVVIL